MAFNRMEEETSPSCFASITLLLGTSCGLYKVFGRKKASPDKKQETATLAYQRMKSSLSPLSGRPLAEAVASVGESNCKVSQGEVEQKATVAFPEPIPELPVSSSQSVEGTVVFRSTTAAKAKKGQSLLFHSPLVLLQVREPSVHITKRNLLPELSCPPPAKKISSSGRPPLAALTLEQVAARALGPGKQYPLSGELDVENCPSRVRGQKPKGRRNVNVAPQLLALSKPSKRKPLPQQANGKKKMKKLFPSVPVSKSCSVQARKMNLGFSDPFDRSTPFFIFADPDF